MNNVYEITITKEVMKTETSTELVELEEISNQSKETLMSLIKQKYGEGEEGVKINIVSSPTEKKPEKYFGETEKYEPSILHLGEPDASLLERDFNCQKGEPFFGDKITFPENTKSVFAYHSQSHNRKTLLPCHSLLFYFSIEKEMVVDLWERGKIKHLMNFNIIPTAPEHVNPIFLYNFTDWHYVVL